MKTVNPKSVVPQFQPAALSGVVAAEPLATIRDERPAVVVQRKLQDLATATVQRKENKTGLSDNLKSGIEKLSGMSMDDVRVHRNSDKPAQLNAHAYAQGTDIHLAAGQEKHLPHEAWHVVQQKQGRVKPTMQMKGKVAINDDQGLEREADVMGRKALASSNSKNELQPEQVAKRSFIAQLKPFDLGKVKNLLAMGTSKRYRVLEDQSIPHLRRIAGILNEEKQDEQVKETLEQINEIISEGQMGEITSLGKSANWANAMLYIDDVLKVNIKAQKSGMSPGRKKNKHGRATGSSTKRSETEISVHDSEATVFNMLKPQVNFDEIRSAKSSVKIVFASTNGACDGCKGRINTFMSKEIVPLVAKDVKVSSEYKYNKPEKHTTRGDVATQYGWTGDIEISESWWMHETRYK